MGRIILAEDDEVAGELIVNALMDAGHAVALFDNGRDALSAINFRKPHLVILDCNMPVMTGIEALRTLRLDPEMFGLPVLILTARCAQADEDIAMFEGANGYLRKPIDPDDLVVHAEALMRDPNNRAARAVYLRG